MTEPAASANASATVAPATLAQKLLARAAGIGYAAVGTVVVCRVDLAMSHDSSGPRRVAPLLKALGARVWDPSRYVVVTDHFVGSADPEAEIGRAHV